MNNDEVFSNFVSRHYPNAKRVGFIDYEPSCEETPYNFMNNLCRWIKTPFTISLVRGKDNGEIYLTLVFKQAPCPEDLIKIGIFHPRDYHSLATNKWGFHRGVNIKDNRYMFAIYVN